jgi:alpha-beta hydrolase superfamily lysophospholipase
MNMVNYFVPKGLAIYSFDQRGHGRSEGLRGYTERFSDYLYDLEKFSNKVRSRHRDAKIFILGHSVGGTIAAAYAVHHQDEFDGLIFSGVTLKPGPSLSPVKILIARFLSLLLPKIGIEAIEASTISRDKAVVAAYTNDPLVYHGKIRARLGAELIRAMQELTHQISQIELPILIMHGASDRLCAPEGSQILYERVSSIDKTLKLYDGFYHEIFNEPGHEKVFADVAEWLAVHT